MDLRNTLVEKYINKVTDLEKVLKTKRFDIGEADSGKESRFPTGRVELEDQIQQIENNLFEAKNLLKLLRELPPDQDKNLIIIGSTVTLELEGTPKTFLLIKGAGNFNEGILSIDSPLGKSVLGKGSGESISLNSNEGSSTIKILSIN